MTGRIAQKLYPQAQIQVCGFENSKLKENSFDVAVGNVPFGDIHLYDKKYNPHNLLIHDYFFSKSLDMVKPGGVVAFITSKGTLDKLDQTARRLLAEKAEFLGAVRLPNNAFKANAGTEVTSDIIFLQKRTEPVVIEPDKEPLWIFSDKSRRDDLVETYNRIYNSSRPREYNGSHLNFVGMNPEITLRKHQLDAVARCLYGGNTLLAHEVGAGKTFEMIAAAMEGKRLGLHSKSLICVPNHLTEQIGSDFIKLYPNANILVATKKDFEKENRRALMAKIATGNYDAIIIGHSQLEKIPISQERQQQYIREQIEETMRNIEELKAMNGERYQIKQAEKTKANLEAKLQKLLDSPKDDTVTFEELGIDKLFVDEAHLFKNLFLSTKMQNVSGISTSSDVQKTADLFMKTKYMDEITGGKGIVFATGTPISNTMCEIYNMMRYLQMDKLREMHLEHFDAWASTFGENVTQMELTPEGNSYRAKTRFSKFFNLPELMAMFKECADIQTADTLNLPGIPECEVHNVAVEPSEVQKELVDALSKRAEAIHNRQVDPSTDNMLKITTDGRKIGLDQRLINPDLPDEPGSKVNTCIDNVFRIWTDTAEIRGTQLVFCDFSTPKNDGSFNVYDDIKQAPSASETSQQEQAVSTEAEQLFEAFQTAETNTSADIAKQQDIIDTLNAKIKDLQAKQVRKNQDAVVFEQVAKSNAFPHLSSFFLSKAEGAKRSAAQQNDKIKKLKKKIKKAEKKIKRLKRKQQKNELFKGFFSSLFDKNTDRSAYVTGMQALREDSLMRAEKKLDRVEQKLETARAKLADGKLSHTEAVNLKARIKKLEGQKETLEAKINNLTELEQSLNKLAKMEVVSAQLEEIKEFTLQNAAGKGIISQAVDGMTSPDVTSTIQKAVTGEVKEEAEMVVPDVSEDEATPTEEKPVVPEQPPVAEKQDNAQQADTPTADKKPAAAGKADLRKREHLTDKEFQAVIDAGLPVRAKKVAANDITVIFDVSQTAQLDQAIASTKTQAMKR